MTDATTDSAMIHRGPTLTTGNPVTTSMTGNVSPPQNVSLRRQLLQEAAKIVDGQRDDEYGSPEDSFKTIASVWSSLIDYEFTTTDVALLMAGLKLARLSATNGTHHDSWIDLAGYAACGYEVSNV